MIRTQIGLKDPSLYLCKIQINEKVKTIWIINEFRKYDKVSTKYIAYLVVREDISKTGVSLDDRFSCRQFSCNKRC